MASKIRVKITDTAREPRQPRRLEKKRNTWIGSFATAGTHGLYGAGRTTCPPSAMGTGSPRALLAETCPGTRTSRKCLPRSPACTAAVISRITRTVTAADGAMQLKAEASRYQ